MEDVMSVEELRRRVKWGATLGVLADLNACTVAEIRSRLGSYAEGVEDGCTDEDVVLVDNLSHLSGPDLYRVLYDRGWTDVRIAAKCGVGRTAVWSWRHRLGLPLNKQR